MVQTYPIEQRDNKVQISDFSEANIGSQISDLVHDLPKVLAGLAITDFVNDILVAKNKNKPIIAMIGGHVIKCGLSKIIIELARRGFITALAMNGSAAIHDFEIAFLGATSESVEQSDRAPRRYLVWMYTGSVDHPPSEPQHRVLPRNNGFEPGYGRSFEPQHPPRQNPQ